MEFNSNEKLYEFAKILLAELKLKKEANLEKRILNWEATFYTTSTELFIDFKQILLDIKSICGLPNTIMIDIDRCLFAINSALDFH